MKIEREIYGVKVPFELEENEIRKIMDELYYDNCVTETCPNCEAEVTLIWNVKEDGMKSFCPHCGHKMMLCSMCNAVCDWDENTNSCCMCNEKRTYEVKITATHTYSVEACSEDEALRIAKDTFHQNNSECTELDIANIHID